MFPLLNCEIVNMVSRKRGWRLSPLQVLALQYVVEVMFPAVSVCATVTVQVRSLPVPIVRKLSRRQVHLDIPPTGVDFSKVYYILLIE